MIHLVKDAANSVSVRAATVLVAAMVVLAFGGYRHTAAQDLGTHQITVVGTATATTTADIATFVVGTEALNTDIQTAMGQVDGSVDSIVSALVQTGIEPEDIEILAVQVLPEDLLDTRTGAATGRLMYRVRSSLRVIARDVNTLRAVINAAVGAGANRVSDYAFGVQDLTPLEREARAAALEDARTRANELAAGANLEVQDAAVISETVLVNGDRLALTPTGMWIAGGTAAGFPASAGRAAVTVQVTVSFRAHP